MSSQVASRKSQRVKRNLITLCALCFALFATPALACTVGSCAAGQFCAIDPRITGGSACYQTCTSSDVSTCSPAERCISVTGHEVCAPNDSPLVTGATPAFGCTCMIGSAPVGTPGTLVANDCEASDDLIAAYSIAPLATITNNTYPSGPLLTGETQAGKCRAICVIVGDRANTESLGSSARCLHSTVAVSSSVNAPAAPEQAFEAIVPVLGTEVPGLTFTPATKNGDSVSVPYIAQYINAAYRYLVSVVLIVSIIMVVYGGFRYLVAASVGDVKNGKKIIVDALMGMLITLGAYMILNTVNPATTNLTTLDLSNIARIDIDTTLNTTQADTIGPEEAPGTPAPAGGTAPAPAAPLTYTDCPVSLSSAAVVGGPPTQPRSQEFIEAARTISPSSSKPLRVQQIAAAASKCGVTLGSCGKTVQTINAIVGINNRGRQLHSINTAQMNSLTPLKCVPYSSACAKPNMEAAYSVFHATDPSWPDAWADELRPGDAFTVFNANSDGFGLHIAIFMSWDTGGRANVVQGAYGKLVKGGTICIRSNCRNHTPLVRTFRAE